MCRALREVCRALREVCRALREVWRALEEEEVDAPVMGGSVGDFVDFGRNPIPCRHMSDNWGRLLSGAQSNHP